MDNHFPPVDTTNANVALPLGTSDSETPEPVQELRIAGFWRRAFADLIDLLMISVVLHTLGAVFPEFFYKVGPNGRVITGGLVVAYLTLAGSYVGKGQTLGKRLLRIAVTDAQGYFLGVRRAFVRSSALWVIFLLNQWPAINTNPVLFILQAAVLFGGMLGLLYGYVVSRAARQGPHDILVNSLVVRVPAAQRKTLQRSTLSGPGAHAPVRIPARQLKHTVVMSVFYGAIVIGLAVLVVANTRDDALWELTKTVNEDSPFFMVEVSRTGDRLYLSAWYDEDCAADASGEFASDACNAMAEEWLPVVESYDDLLELSWGQLTVYRMKDIGAPINFWTRDRSGRVEFGSYKRDDMFVWHFFILKQSQMEVND